MKDSLNLVIVRDTGYVGIELTKILSKYPYAKILYLCKTNTIGKSIKIFEKTAPKLKLFFVCFTHVCNLELSLQNFLQNSAPVKFWS